MSRPATATGLTGFAATLPVVLGGTFGGVLVDRIGYRRASVLADLVSGVTIALVPLLHTTVALPFPVLLGLVLATGLLDTPGQMARNALLPAAAARAGTPIERGWPVRGHRAWRPAARCSRRGTRGRAARSAERAGTRRGDIRGQCGTHGWTRPSLDRYSGVRRARRWLLAQLHQGLAFTVREPLLRAVILLVLITNMFDAAKSTVLLPVYAERDLGGAVAFGLLVGTMGGGAVLGALMFSAVGHRLPRRTTFVTAFALGGGPPCAALAAGLPLLPLLGIMLIAGFAAGAINPIIGAVRLERVPPGMRALVFGLVGAGCWAAMPIGALLGGVSVEHLGLPTTAIAIGIAYILVTLTPLLGGPWRDLDATRIPAEPPAPPQPR